MLVLTRPGQVERFCDMYTSPTHTEEPVNRDTSPVVPLEQSSTHLLRKNNRTPWDVSALEGIKLGSSLSALRTREREAMAAQNRAVQIDALKT